MSTAPRPARRARDACVRCRRQKLKCDAEKPCLLCRRAGVECEARSSNRRRNSNSYQRLGSDRSFDASITSPHLQYTGRDVSIACDTESGEQPSEFSPESGEFGANTSSINFAKELYGPVANNNPQCTAIIPTETRRSPSRRRAWTLQNLQMPPSPIMELLIDAYFQRSHWFIMIFHEPSFRKKVGVILSRSEWRPQERGLVLAVLAVAVIGLQAVSNDEMWAGHSVMRTQALKCSSLLDNMIAEIRRHLVDLLEDCQIETVQVCTLLGTFYIYHGNPNLAWSLLGMATRSAYALALHSEQVRCPSKIVAEVRRRCWNHLKVADTFASMIYGRPTSLNPAFSSAQTLSDMDDTVLSPAETSTTDSEHHLSRLTFHILKCDMYEIVAEIISRFSVLQVRSYASSNDLNRLQQTITEIEEKLERWRTRIPVRLQEDYCRGFGPGGMANEESNDTSIDHNGASQRHVLDMQAITLQVLYDSTVLLLHRPILENAISKVRSSEIPHNPNELSFNNSLDICVRAAIRLSKTPIDLLKNQIIVSFVLMHFFTAGIILCITPSIAPFSDLAQECKARVLIIIKTCARLRKYSHVAGLTQRLLGDVFKLTVQREAERAMHDDTDDARPQEWQNSATEHSSYLSRMMQSSTPLYEQGHGESRDKVADQNVWASQPQPSALTPSTEYPLSVPDSRFHSFYYNDVLNPLSEGHLPREEFQWPFEAFGQAMLNLGTEHWEAADLLSPEFRPG